MLDETTFGALVIPNGEITDGTITISIATLKQLIDDLESLTQRVASLESQ